MIILMYNLSLKHRQNKKVEFVTDGTQEPELNAVYFTNFLNDKMKKDNII